MRLSAHCAHRSGGEDREASRRQADAARATRGFFAERTRASVNSVSFFPQSSPNDRAFHFRATEGRASVRTDL